MNNENINTSGIAPTNTDDAPNALPNTPIINAEKSPLEQLLNEKDVLLMIYPKNKFGGFHHDIIQEDEVTVYDLVRKNNSANKSLLVVLDSGGGNVYSAVKIMDILRTRYDYISIAVAQEAKSSASLMCLGANKIIMGPQSEIGPLDKPFPHPEDETTRISALDIVRSLNSLIDVASEKQEQVAGSIKRNFGISRENSLKIASNFTAKLMSPLFAKENAKTYNEAKRLLVIAELYGKEFLTEYMFEKFPENHRGKLAEIVMSRFIWEYPDHIFAIRRKELSDLLLTVEPAEELRAWEELWTKFKALSAGKTKTIKFL